MKKETVCFIDMDNVLSDNDYQAFQMIGRSPKGLRNKNTENLTNEERFILFEESQLINFSEQYWRTMPARLDSEKLIDDCLKRYDSVKIISSYIPPIGIPNKILYIRQYKIRWLFEKFGDKVDLDDIIVSKYTKSSHMENNKINVLISNDLDEVKKWRTSGGIGFLYNDYKQFNCLMNGRTSHGQER